jgi:hypothetical protein
MSGKRKKAPVINTLDSVKAARAALPPRRVEEPKATLVYLLEIRMDISDEKDFLDSVEEFQGSYHVNIIDHGRVSGPVNILG